MDFIRGEHIFFMVCPKDIVIAKPRNFDDHIQWLIEHKHFEEAFEETKNNPKELKKHSYTVKRIKT